MALGTRGSGWPRPVPPQSSRGPDRTDEGARRGAKAGHRRQASRKLGCFLDRQTRRRTRRTRLNIGADHEPIQPSPGLRTSDIVIVYFGFDGIQAPPHRSDALRGRPRYGVDRDSSTDLGSQSMPAGMMFGALMRNCSLTFLRSKTTSMSDRATPNTHLRTRHRVLSSSKPTVASDSKWPGAPVRARTRKLTLNARAPAGHGQLSAKSAKWRCCLGLSDTCPSAQPAIDLHRSEGRCRTSLGGGNRGECHGCR